MTRSALADRYELEQGVLTLRPPAAADQPFLEQLYSTTRDDELASVPWANDEERRRFLDLQCRAQRLHYEVEYPESDHRLILRDGEPIGRIWIDVGESEVAVLDMALLPSERGRGIATLLLDEVIADAAHRSVPVRMCVQKLNPRPLTLLARLGFVVYDEDVANVWLRHETPQTAVA